MKLIVFLGSLAHPFLIGLLFIFGAEQKTYAQQKYQLMASLHMGPKIDFYRISNGSTEFVTINNDISASAGMMLGMLVDGKILLETGLFNNNMNSAFTVKSRSGFIISDQNVFPTLRTMLIPVKFSVQRSLKQNWSLFYGFSAWVMVNEELNKQPGINQQILREEPVSGTTDFLNYEVNQNTLTGSNILFSAHFGAEKQLFEQVYMTGELHLRSAMGYINEYTIDYRSNNDRPRKVIVSSRGTAPLLLIGLRFKATEQYR